MSRFAGALLIVLLGWFATPASSQDFILFSSNRPAAGAQGGGPTLFTVSAGTPEPAPLHVNWPGDVPPIYAPSVSPDGKWLAFVAQGSLWKMSLEDREPVFVSANAEIHTTAWSADGNLLYYSIPGSCAEDLGAVDLRTGERYKAVDAGVDIPENLVARVTVSVNDEIAVIGGNCGAGPRNLYARAPGEAAYRLVLQGANLASWSPDGEKLVVTRCPPPQNFCHVWTVNRDGGDPTQLTFGPELMATDPSWAPNGSKILFTGTSYRTFPTDSNWGHLFIMDPVADADPVAITSGDGLFDQFATWVHRNTMPVAEAGNPRVVECTGSGGAPVTLDGGASFDADGDELTYIWKGPFPEGHGTVTGANPTVTLPLGPSTVSLVVNDGHVDSAPDSVKILVSVRVRGFEPPLGPLVLEGQPIQAPDRAFKQGRALPMRLQTWCGALPLCGIGVVPPHIVGLLRSGEALDIDTLDLGVGNANDDGFDFMPVDGYWAFNLKTTSLAPGTYTIIIQMMDRSRWVGGFVLK